jgi:hypothetical protein
VIIEHRQLSLQGFVFVVLFGRDEPDLLLVDDSAAERPMYEIMDTFIC